MIRLTHIITSFDIGGAEQFVLDLCRRFDRTQFEVNVVAVVRGGPLRSEFHDAGIPTDVIGKTTKLGISTIRTLTEFLRMPKPDIVHTHLFGGDTWGRIAAIRAGVSHIVSTEHNVNLDEGFVKRIVKRQLANHTDRIIAVSDAVRSYSVLVEHLSPGKVFVIPNGVDLNQFRPQPRTPHEGVRFMSIGRLVRQKGFDILLDAFAICREALPNATLTIVGDGPLRPHLEDQARTYHIADRITFLGFRRDLADLYQRADIAVFPSRWEGLGIAAIEASACGLPVIASAVGGLQEVVRDHETGILVPPCDPKALADACIDLARSRTSQVLFGHAARRHVERNFDITKTVKKYEEMYRNLMRAK